MARRGMPTDASSPDPLDRPVLPWRVVAGALLHFVFPAYLLVGLAGCAAGFLSGLTVAAVASRAISFSVRFVAFYLLIAVAATIVALLLDPALRRRRRYRTERDPHATERQSRLCVATAVSTGRARLDRDTVAMLDVIASSSWDYADPAFRSLATDLSEVVRTSIAAQATAMPERRHELTAVTAVMLTRIASALRDLNRSRTRLDEGDLRTVARYVDTRYPPSDCAGDSFD